MLEPVHFLRESSFCSYYYRCLRLNVEEEEESEMQDDNEEHEEPASKKRKRDDGEAV
jgi:hypothetical protein